MRYDHTFGTLRTKLKTLRQRDPHFQRFGARAHRYRLNPPLLEAEIAVFEARHGIALPPDYRRFLTEIGDGGAGPYDGLLPLEQATSADLSQPFPYTELHCGEPENDDDDGCITGVVRLANCGCGITRNLVVNGPAYGQVWVDDRANDGGIYPDGGMSFLGWYVAWLNDALKEAASYQS